MWDDKSEVGVYVIDIWAVWYQVILMKERNKTTRRDEGRLLVRVP